MHRGQSALEYIILLATFGAVVAFAGPFFTAVQGSAEETFVSAIRFLIRTPGP